MLLLLYSKMFIVKFIMYTKITSIYLIFVLQLVYVDDLLAMIDAAMPANWMQLVLNNGTL